MGLDLSLTATGIAIFDSSTMTAKHLSVVDLTKVPLKKLKGMPRLEHIRKEVQAVARAYEPELVVIEGYSFGSGGRAFSLGELGGVVLLTLFKMRKTVFSVPPSTLKKFITGSGKGGEGSKGRMMLELFKRWGISTEDNNVADAACLAIAGVALSKTSASFTKTQLASLKSEIVCDFR